jgi:hypothetical protein
MDQMGSRIPWPSPAEQRPAADANSLCSCVAPAVGAAEAQRSASISTKVTGKHGPLKQHESAFL